MHGVGSRNKLTKSHARLYPGDSVVDVAGRAICAVECLPRKELHEAYEMAVRVSTAHPHLPAGTRVVDLCCGYGLLAQFLVILDARFTRALAVDRRLPPNHTKVHAALVDAFPVLAGAVSFVTARLDTVAVDAADLVVSSHACGSLSDDVCAAAVCAAAPMSVLPCCHEWRYREDVRDAKDPAAAIDAARVVALGALGYAVVVDAIPEDVSPKNRLLHARPARTSIG